MEIGESTEQAAVRETLEESQAQVERICLFAVLSLPHIGQTYLVFRGPMRSPDFGAGEESLEVRLFSLSAIPWDEIAFPVVKDALRRYVDDVTRGRVPCACCHLAGSTLLTVSRMLKNAARDMRDERDGRDEVGFNLSTSRLSRMSRARGSHILLDLCIN